jgi:hypothetical protein
MCPLLMGAQFLHSSNYKTVYPAMPPYEWRELGKVWKIWMTYSTGDFMLFCQQIPIVVTTEQMLWTHYLVLLSFLIKEAFNINMLISSMQIPGLYFKFYFTCFFPYPFLLNLK